MAKHPQISVVISTYNALVWLKKTLCGFEHQIFKDFEIVIADDGSRDETKDYISEFSKRVDFPVKHVWHEDNGFQKSEILNKALLQCDADYIVMTDGDCIPRKDFLSVHQEEKSKGYFLSGGYFKLPMSISELISEEDIKTQRCFDVNWLKNNGLASSYKNMKLTASGITEKLLNYSTPTSATWNGHNASGWKADIFAVNGFDERMQYGGQDRELGERLFNYGIKSKQIRYSAICIHLDHPRGYKTQKSIDKNLKIRKATKEDNRKWTDFGIKQ